MLHTHTLSLSTHSSLLVDDRLILVLIDIVGHFESAALMSEPLCSMSSESSSYEQMTMMSQRAKVFTSHPPQ
jgi:hypothetical protein